MLADIQRLLSKRGVLSASEISAELGVDREALGPMLDMLERKGRVERMEPACRSVCRSMRCAGCPSDNCFYKVSEDAAAKRR